MTAGRIPGQIGPRPIAVARPAALVLTPKEIFGILRRHILMIISVTVLGFIISGISWFLLRKYYPRYTARTFIRVLPPVEKDPAAIGGGGVGKDVEYGHRVSVVNLIRRQSTLQQLIDKDKIRETKWFKGFGESKAVSIEKAFKDLLRHFGVSAQRDAEFVNLTMTCCDKKEAADIVNEMVDLFLANQGSAKKREVTDKLQALQKQRNEVASELRLAEGTLDDIRRTTGFTDLEEHRFEHPITQRLNKLEREEADINLDLQQISSTISTLEQQAIGPINEQVASQIENDATMIMLNQRLATMKMVLAGSLTKFGENHRIVQQTQELVSRTKKEREIRKSEIAEQTRQANLKDAQDALFALGSRLKVSQAMRNEAAEQKRQLDLARVLYEQNVKIRDERQVMLDSLKAQIDKRTIMHDDPETPKVLFAGYAPVPLQISSPLWYVYFPGGIVLGFISGIGLAFLVELLNDLVRTPRDVSKYLHIPLLGVIPDADEDEQMEDIDLCHVIQQAPYSIISESYRRFRTNLKLSESAAAAKTLLISSGIAGEGRTSVAVNLAFAFVAEGRKVLLIDANFWRPVLHTVFTNPEDDDKTEEQSAFGLADLLTGRCTFAEVVKPAKIEGLSLIVAGQLPSNPTELLGGPQMESLIKQQHGNYDYIIVDGPPVLLVSATKMLARFVDGTVMVFNAAATRRGAALRSINEFKQVNATVVGCVLFAVKAMKGGYFQEQFRSLQEYRQLQLAHSA
ncbi:MAG: polysaccharide biosynthesis tyrosine autokinase [Planctomycetota bacterium]